jgi:hypothetical protein
MPPEIIVQVSTHSDGQSFDSMRREERDGLLAELPGNGVGGLKYRPRRVGGAGLCASLTHVIRGRVFRCHSLKTYPIKPQIFPEKFRHKSPHPLFQSLSAKLIPHKFPLTD